MDDIELRDILDFAVESAQLAGAYTLGYFNANTPVELKADRSPVTDADRGAEERLRQRISRAFPTHGIVGEEFGVHEGIEDCRWILDPIDGTYSFISGVPLYAVLVAWEVAGEVLIGVIHLPALGETIYAGRGLGAWWNGRRARVSPETELSRARVAHCGARGFLDVGRWAEFQRLIVACDKDRGWCDAYAYALVATGRAEVALDPVMNLWDTAALAPVVREAGGRLSDWKGAETHTAPEALATNGTVHAAVLRALAG